MNTRAMTTSTLSKNIWLGRAAVALLAASAFVFVSHAQAAPAGQGNHGSSKIILQHHPHTHAHERKIILQHHKH